MKIGLAEGNCLLYLKFETLCYLWELKWLRKTFKKIIVVSSEKTFVYLLRLKWHREIVFNAWRWNGESKTLFIYEGWNGGTKPSLVPEVHNDRGEYLLNIKIVVVGEIFFICEDNIAEGNGTKRTSKDLNDGRKTLFAYEGWNGGMKTCFVSEAWNGRGKQRLLWRERIFF